MQKLAVSLALLILPLLVMLPTAVHAAEGETDDVVLSLGVQVHLGSNPADYFTVLPEGELVVRALPFLRVGALVGGGEADTAVGVRSSFKFGAYLEGYYPVGAVDALMRAGMRFGHRTGAGLPAAFEHAPFASLGIRITTPPIDDLAGIRTYFLVDQEFSLVTSDAWLSMPTILAEGALQWTTGLSVGVAF